MMNSEMLKVCYFVLQLNSDLNLFHSFLSYLSAVFLGLPDAVCLEQLTEQLHLYCD